MRSDSLARRKCLEEIMQSNTWVQLTDSRGRDAHAVIMPYVISTLSVLALTVFGGERLEVEAIKFAIAAWVVLGSVWTMLWFDGVIADLGAAMKDMDEEMAARNLGKNFAIAPFPFFRVFNAFGITVMIVVQLIALYS